MQNLEDNIYNIGYRLSRTEHGIQSISHRVQNIGFKVEYGVPGIYSGVYSFGD